MGFEDLDQYLSPHLDLPIRGKVYRVEPVDAQTGLLCQRTAELAAQVMSGEKIGEADIASLNLDDGQEKDLQKRLLGAAYDEMLADAVPWEYLKRATATVYTWVVVDLETAEEVWRTGTARPEAQRPTPQDRKAPAKKSARQGSRGGSSRSSSPRATGRGPASSASGI